MMLIDNRTIMMTVITAFVLGVMFVPVGYAQPHENIVVKTNGLIFEKGEPISIIAMAENTSNQPTVITEFKKDVAGISGPCGVDYLNIAMIKGSYTDIQNYEQLLNLKDQYINFEYKDSDTKLPCKGIDKNEIVSVQLSEPKSDKLTLEALSKLTPKMIQGFFGDKTPRTAHSDIVIDYIESDGDALQLEYSLLYGKQDITQYFDTNVIRKSVSSTETKVYRNAQDFTLGEYTIIGSTMSGSISEPVVINIQPNKASITSLDENVLYSIIGVLLSSIGIVGATIINNKKNRLYA